MCFYFYVWSVFVMIWTLSLANKSDDDDKWRKPPFSKSFLWAEKNSIWQLVSCYNYKKYK